VNYVSEVLQIIRYNLLRIFGLRIFKVQRTLRRSRPLKIIVGAFGTHQEGWYSTEESWLNLLKHSDWERVFRPSSLDAILAEHVWEHLTEEQALVAARTCYRYLKNGGYVRVAVPDGLHPDPRYIAWVRVNGCGPGASSHKVLYTYRSLTQVFAGVGFKVNLLEYFDDKGKFHRIDWNAADGRVMRSLRLDRRNTDGMPRYTSIILDAIKQ
jgi:predicted SAM-dependent methyltransferase